MGDRKYKAGKVDVHSFNLLPPISGETVESVTSKSQGSILKLHLGLPSMKSEKKYND